MDLTADVINQLAQENYMMTDVDKLSHLYHLLTQVLVYGVPGAIVELGCNEGKTSAYFQKLINYYDPDREFHVFDSFEGLPERRTEYDIFKADGDCRTTEQCFIDTFKRQNLQLPVIHKGWFEDTLPDSLPTKIAFAYLDGDFYESITTSLKYVYPRLAKNAIAAIDDYTDNRINPRAWYGFPGVKKACDEYLEDKPEHINVLVGVSDMALGYLRKR